MSTVPVIPALRPCRDYYGLLGISRDERDLSKIEEAALARSERARRYQLSHPEQAADCLGRIARALATLSDPAARAAYAAPLSDAHGDAHGPRASVLASALLLVERGPGEGEGCSAWEIRFRRVPLPDADGSVRRGLGLGLGRGGRCRRARVLRRGGGSV